MFLLIYVYFFIHFFFLYVGQEFFFLLIYSLFYVLITKAVNDVLFKMLSSTLYSFDEDEGTFKFSLLGVIHYVLIKSQNFSFTVGLVKLADVLISNLYLKFSNEVVQNQLENLHEYNKIIDINQMINKLSKAYEII